MQRPSAHYTDEKIRKRTFVIGRPRNPTAEVSAIIDTKRIGRSACTIENVFVGENYRRQGLASLLMKEAIQFAIDENCYKIVLICEENSPAQLLYEKHGFKQHQTGMRLDLE